MNVDVEITRQIFLAAQLLEKTADRIFATLGLTIKTHNILLLIQDRINTTTKLAKAMNLSLAGITQKTKVLEKKGFISRRVSGEDLRTWQFELTKKGKKALKDIIRPYETAAGMLYSEFSKSEKNQMLALLGRTTTHLSGVKEEQLKTFIAQLKMASS